MAAGIKKTKASTAIQETACGPPAVTNTMVSKPITEQREKNKTSFRPKSLRKNFLSFM